MSVDKTWGRIVWTFAIRIEKKETFQYVIQFTLNEPEIST